MTAAWTTVFQTGKSNNNLPHNPRKVSSQASDMTGMDSLLKCLWIARTSFQKIRGMATVSWVMFCSGFTASRAQLREIMGRWRLAAEMFMGKTCRTFRLEEHRSKGHRLSFNSLGLLIRILWWLMAIIMLNSTKWQWILACQVWLWRAKTLFMEFQVLQTTKATSLNPQS